MDRSTGTTTGALALVRYLVTGAGWLVEVEGTRPRNAVRKARLLDGVEVVEDLVATVCCGLLCATVTGLDYVGHALAVVEADRVVNDHPDFLVTLLDGVTPARVAYVREALLPVCPAHNGSSRRDYARDELAAAAVARLDRYGVRA